MIDVSLKKVNLGFFLSPGSAQSSSSNLYILSRSLSELRSLVLLVSLSNPSAAVDGGSIDALTGGEPSLFFLFTLIFTLAFLSVFALLMVSSLF